MSKYFIGVDGGGTKTDVVCANEQGEVVGRGNSGPTNLTNTSVGAATFDLIEGVRQAMENIPEGGLGADGVSIASIVIGLAGVDSQLDHDRALEVFSRALQPYHADKIKIVNDTLIALENGSDSANAIVLISGTGTNCFGRNEHGQTAKASGMDYLLADQGSGYYIGRQVLREAVKSYDGRRQNSLLEKLVCEYFHIDTIEGLKEKVYNPPLGKIEVANIAMLCFVAFQAGDAAAQLIIEHAVCELELLVQAVVRRLDLVQTAFDLVLVGSVARSEHIEPELTNKLLSQFSQMVVKKNDDGPVFGALKLAKSAL